MCAKTTWPLSSSTENVVLGKTCLMLPNASSGASLTLSELLGLGGRESALRRRLRIAMGVLLYNMKCNPLKLRAAARRKVGFEMGTDLSRWRNFIDQAKDRAYE
jgi:hypothetical protein